MLWRMIGVPELRGYPKVFAEDEPICDCPLDAVANLRLIAVVTSGVKMPVPCFYRVIHGLRGGLFGIFQRPNQGLVVDQGRSSRRYLLICLDF